MLLLAPVRLFAMIFSGVFRVGFAILVTGPVALIGGVAVTLLVLVLYAVAVDMYEYNHNPVEQLQSARNALVMVRRMDSDVAKIRRTKGLPPLSAEERRAPIAALEGKVARLKAEVDTQAHPMGASQ
jgi:hypothetical protein